MIAGRHAQSHSVRHVLEDVENRIRDGETLADAVKAYKLFSNVECALIKAGENSGFLDKIFKGLSEWFEFLLVLERGFIQKLLYPVFLIHFAALMLPFPMFFAGGSWLQYLTAAGVILAPFYLLAFTVVGILPFFRQNVKGAARLFDSLVLMVPFVRKIIIKLEMLRFCSAFRYCVMAGVPMGEGIELSISTVTNLVIHDKLAILADTVEAGDPVHTGLRRISIIPDLVVNMFETGETGGKLEETLGKVTDYYNEEVTFSLKNTTRIVNFAIYFTIVLFIAYNIIKSFAGVYSDLGNF